MRSLQTNERNGENMKIGFEFESISRLVLTVYYRRTCNRADDVCLVCTADWLLSNWNRYRHGTWLRDKLWRPEMQSRWRVSICCQSIWWLDPFPIFCTLREWTSSTGRHTDKMPGSTRFCFRERKSMINYKRRQLTRVAYLSIQWRLPSTKYRTPCMVLFIMYSMSSGHADFFFVGQGNQITITNAFAERHGKQKNALDLVALTCLMASTPSLSLLLELCFRFLCFFFFVLVFCASKFLFKTVADITASSVGWLERKKGIKIVSGNWASSPLWE